MNKLRVLVACEFSGIVREAFRAKGHDAWSCDILPTEIPGQHIQGDVLAILNDGWDMMIAHPPCTRICNSGVMWLERRNLWDDLYKAVDFFNCLLDANIHKICVENPIPHKYADIPKYSQIIQPWWFGHGETKATCLWLKNLPKLQPSDIVEGREQRLHKLPPSPTRAKERSRTYRGVAEGMAEQWG